MASKPVFSKSRSNLLERLRLKDLDPKSAANAIIDTAITEVRVSFYNELGATRVAELTGFDVTDNPETSEELQRADAVICEVKWVRVKLMQVLKIFFADESGGAQQEWNELGILRDAGGNDDSLVENLLSDIGDTLERLKTKDVKAKRQVRASSFGSEDRIDPGSTIWS